MSEVIQRRQKIETALREVVEAYNRAPTLGHAEQALATGVIQVLRELDGLRLLEAEGATFEVYLRTSLSEYPDRCQAVQCSTLPGFLLLRGVAVYIARTSQTVRRDWIVPAADVRQIVIVPAEETARGALQQHQQLSST